MSLYPTQDTASESIAKRVQAAIKIARAGDRFTARRMLLDIVENDPGQEDVWLWLAGLSEDLEEAKTYLETVLALSPGHVRAAEGLRIIEQRLASRPPETPTAAVAAKFRQAARGAARVCDLCGTPIRGHAQACPNCTDRVAKLNAEANTGLEEITGALLGETDTSQRPSSYDVNSEITPSFTLSVEQGEAIDACLERMAYESEASSIILADVTGQLISERGKTEGMNTQVLSALAAGELSATQEMARLVGERARFSLLLHEGEERSVYLSPVGMKMLLIVVFDGRTPIGLVRIIIKNAVDELGPILTRPATRPAEETLGEALSGDFAQQLEDEMDASLDMLIG